MITKVVIHRNELTLDNVGITSDTELVSFDITDLLMEEDYVLNYRTEFRTIFEQIPSDISLTFDNDYIFGQGFTLYQFMQETIAVTNQYLALSIYLDNNTTPEFWGAVDYSSIYYDRDNDIIRFQVIDFISKYKEIWEERDLPDIWNDYTKRTAKIYEILDLVLERSHLLSGYNYNVGNLADKDIDLAVNHALTTSEDDDPYTIAEYLEYLKTKFAAYLFISGDRKLNFVSYKSAINDAVFEEEKVISVEEFNYPYPIKEAVIVSYEFTWNEPYPPWIEGNGYSVGEFVTYKDAIYYCLLEHQATQETRPDLNSNYWSFERKVENEIEYPANFYPLPPFCLLIRADGSAFALPYFPDATPNDYGLPSTDIDELVKDYVAINRKRYTDFRPDVRVTKSAAIDIQLSARNMLSNVTKDEYYELYKEFFTSRYFERVIIEYDGYDFNLMQRINFRGKNYLIIEIKKNLNNETSTLVLREMYE